MLSEQNSEISKIYFETDNSSLDSNSKNKLKKVAKIIKKKNENYVINGHADERGTREYNLKLGEWRANAVKDFLVKNGVSQDKLKILSYGKELKGTTMSGHYFDKLSNPKGWKENRVVLILDSNNKMIKKDKYHMNYIIISVILVMYVVIMIYGRNPNIM